MNTLVTSFKLGVFLVIIMISLTKFETQNFDESFKPSGTIYGSLMLFFALIGFDTISLIAEEAHSPKTDCPLAMRDTVIVATVVYTLIAFVLIGLGLKTPDVPETAVADLFKLK